MKTPKHEQDGKGDYLYDTTITTIDGSVFRWRTMSNRRIVEDLRVCAAQGFVSGCDGEDSWHTIPWASIKRFNHTPHYE